MTNRYSQSHYSIFSIAKFSTTAIVILDPQSVFSVTNRVLDPSDRHSQSPIVNLDHSDRHSQSPTGFSTIAIVILDHQSIISTINRKFIPLLNGLASHRAVLAKLGYNGLTVKAGETVIAIDPGTGNKFVRVQNFLSVYANNQYHSLQKGQICHVVMEDGDLVQKPI